jgi:hypothetical protein
MLHTVQKADINTVQVHVLSTHIKEKPTMKNRKMEETDISPAFGAWRTHFHCVYISTLAHIKHPAEAAAT